MQKIKKEQELQDRVGGQEERNYIALQRAAPRSGFSNSALVGDKWSGWRWNPADADEHPDNNEINDIFVRSIPIRRKRCSGRDDGANCDSSYR
jgi:hypothetical protein